LQINSKFGSGSAKPWATLGWISGTSKAYRRGLRSFATDLGPHECAI
jgi:hypothetical protein